MDWELHAQCILDNFEYLAHQIDVDTLLPSLTKAQIFSPLYIRRLREHGSVEQGQVLCMDMLRRPYHDFTKFLRCLDASSQTHLAEKLRATERRLRQADQDDGSASAEPVKSSILDHGSGAGLEVIPQSSEIARNSSHQQHPAAPIQQRRSPQQHDERTHGRIAMETGYPRCLPQTHCKIQEDCAVVEDGQYRMQSCPRGYMLIIDNRRFEESTLEDRVGSQVDAHNLRHLFQNILGFEVDVKVNLKAQEMKVTLEAFSKLEAHWKNDSCAVAVLSHGENGSLYGVDGGKLDIQTMVSLFNGRQCPALRGKPKIFILQSCRGKSKDLGVRILSHDGRPVRDGPWTSIPTVPEILENFQRINLDENRDLRDRLPTDSDIIICYSTVPGYVSWREDERGTWFVQAICEVFSTCAHKDSIMDMLIKVNGVVSKEMGMTLDGRMVKQMPEPVCRLLKPWYLYPCPLKTLHGLQQQSRILARSYQPHNTEQKQADIMSYDPNGTKIGQPAAIFSELEMANPFLLQTSVPFTSNVNNAVLETSSGDRQSRQYSVCSHDLNQSHCHRKPISMAAEQGRHHTIWDSPSGSSCTPFLTSPPVPGFGSSPLEENIAERISHPVQHQQPPSVGSGESRSAWSNFQLLAQTNPFAMYPSSTATSVAHQLPGAGYTPVSSPGSGDLHAEYPTTGAAYLPNTTGTAYLPNTTEAAYLPNTAQASDAIPDLDIFQ